MEIDKKEIREVKKLGTLDGSEVKLVSLKGGFHIGLGKKKNGQKDEILAAGSHPAIVAHQISKTYGHSFEQTLNKSEQESMPAVVDYSHTIEASLIKNEGYDIYALKNNTQCEFKLTKHNFDVCTILAKDNGSEIVIEKYIHSSKPIAKEVSETLSKAMDESIKDFAKQLNRKVINRLK